MKVKNIAQLRALVDESGMAVDKQGRVTPKPAPDLPKLPDELVTAVRELVITIKRDIDGRVIPQAVPVPMRTIENKPPQVWVFTVKRGFDQLITEITARAEH